MSAPDRAPTPRQASPELVAIVAAAQNGVIGNGPQIPWHIPGEQRRFKALSMGGVLVMGRKTFDSIGRPLPGRVTVVLTRDRGWRRDGVLTAANLDDALAVAADQGRPVFVVGGAEIYAQAMPRLDRIELTRVHLRPDGDAHFADPDESWVEVAREDHDTHSYLTLRRR